MTKEELEKEAEEYAREWLYHVKDLELHHKEDDKPEYIRIKEAYLVGAEPREKQIERLSKEVDDLENMKATLESTIAELKAQIEKMKCCPTCDNNKEELENRIEAHIDSKVILKGLDETGLKNIKALIKNVCVEVVKNETKELEAQIEEMKSDVKGNIKWADQNKNDQMYCKLNAMFNQWEIKEK